MWATAVAVSCGLDKRAVNCGRFRVEGFRVESLNLRHRVVNCGLGLSASLPHRGEEWEYIRAREAKEGEGWRAKEVGMIEEWREGVGMLEEWRGGVGNGRFGSRGRERRNGRGVKGKEMERGE